MQGLSEARARRQSSGFLLLAGITFVLMLAAGVWFLLSLGGDEPGLRVHPSPSQSGGRYRVADGSALAEDWAVELSASPDGATLRFLAGGRERLVREGLVPTTDQPVIGDGAVRERDGRRVIVLFGTVAPAVGEIEIASGGRDARVEVVDTPRALQLHVRVFVAIIETMDPIEVRVLDRTGEILSEGVLAEPLSATF